MTNEIEMKFFLNDKPIEYEDLMNRLEEHKNWLGEEEKRIDASNKPERKTKKKWRLLFYWCYYWQPILTLHRYQNNIMCITIHGQGR